MSAMDDLSRESGTFKIVDFPESPDPRRRT